MTKKLRYILEVMYISW